MSLLQQARSIISLLPCLGLSTTVLAQQDFSDVEIVPHHVAGPNTRIVPGHGVVFSREDVMGFRDMVLGVVAKVVPVVERGMSYEQLAAADPTEAYNARYGNPERFLRAVYSELGGEN